MEHYISIRRKDGVYSVDISDHPNRGGHCRLFRFLGDAYIFIKEETGKDIPSNWPLVHDFETGEFKSWDESTWNGRIAH